MILGSILLKNRYARSEFCAGFFSSYCLFYAEQLNTIEYSDVRSSPGPQCNSQLACGLRRAHHIHKEWAILTVPGTPPMHRQESVLLAELLSERQRSVA